MTGTAVAEGAHQSDRPQRSDAVANAAAPPPGGVNVPNTNHVSEFRM